MIKLATSTLRRGCVLVILTSLVPFAYWMGTQHETIPRVTRSAGRPLIQLERIGELAPVRIHVADVLVAEGEGYRGSWLIKGDALITCEVSEAKLTEVDSVRRRARLQLPPLKVASARVDFGKSKTWSVENTTWLPWSGGDQDLFRDAAMYHAQQLVEEAAMSATSIESAQVQTELIVRQMYEAVDWHITVEWGRN
eukprot:TRINITY_DN253_c0_g1_i17.p1 TRINITY_DN253_c0_g1~~TRINITY_DN253_c0_g1_i17.p1  ORF type:complete len:196 (+),score=20.29 TRINITY_DN253_c0_g1_i17:526-1113(+)